MTDFNELELTSVEAEGARVDPFAPPFRFRVTDLKQWFYCRRIIYWLYVAPVQRRLPRKVVEGTRNHDLITHLEERRTLRAYGLEAGERRFHVSLTSDTLGLTGKLDALLLTERERIPVEYKDTLGGVRLNHRMQLAGYALLLEEGDGPPVHRGMVYLAPERKVVAVKLDSGVKERVREALAAMRRVVEREEWPEAADRWGKCRDCEYLRFCGDRYEAVEEAEEEVEAVE